MIKYKLLCKACNLSFDSWFSSSVEYEKLKKKKLLNCHNCNSFKIEKNLMAPKVMKEKNNTQQDQNLKKFKDIKNTIFKYQKFIKQNFKFVGSNFAYEARAIHYDKKTKQNRIYGTASKRELKELREEGIETQSIPWIEQKKEN